MSKRVVNSSLRGLFILVLTVMTGVSWAQELVSGQLLIQGATLEVSPSRQEVDPGRPTVVQTSLGQLAPGEIPAGMRVLGDLTGPGLESPLNLSTVPGESFLIPGLTREGTYTLSGIRLVQGPEVLFSAQPASVQIVVHRLVITSVTSRPLTPDEMAAAGVVIKDDSYAVYRYTVGFATESGTVNIPFDLLSGPNGSIELPRRDPYRLPSPQSPPLPSVPQVEPMPIDLHLPASDLPSPSSTGGAPPPVTVPGFLIIPSDVAFLHQFFSAILVVQNGALADSGIELRDLRAVLSLDDDGLRQAATEPPTVPGEPAPVVDPGPDGKLGTSDDLTFIVAQSSGQASWSVEGLQEGQHRISVELTGELDGLASGNPAPIHATAPGVVVVRDPSFALTFIHPWTVRAGESYAFRVVVSNTSTAPVHDLSMKLPDNELSGVQLLGSAEQTVEELLPGDSATVSWDLLSLKTGRVTASAFNTSAPMTASFRFHVGVGELGIPLSPDSLVLPEDVYALPEAVTGPAVELLGLAHSLANAPAGSQVDLPPVGEGIVIRRGQELAAVARRASFGEDSDRCLIDLGLAWQGAATWDTGFDALRRKSRRGHELEGQLAAALGRRMSALGASQALAEIEELAITGRPLLMVMAEGAGYGRSARLVISGLTSRLGAAGQAADTALFSRALPGASILDVDAPSAGWQGELGLVAIPLNADGAWAEDGYQIQLRGIAPGNVSLSAIVVMPDGSTRQIEPQAVDAVAGSLAYLAIDPASDKTDLYIDSNGDHIEDAVKTVPVTVAEAPVPRLLLARFDSTLQKPDGGPYKQVLLLFSQRLDSEALEGVDPAQWVVSSHLELPADGGSLVVDRPRTGAALTQQIDPHFLVLTASAPLNPQAQLSLSSGSAPAPFVGGRALTLTDEPITTGDGLASGAVRGVVVGGDGAVVPGALVELYELVYAGGGIQGGNWILVGSDSVTADANGRFIFDAVRFRDGQVPVADAAFMIRARDPASSHEARVMARLPGDGTVRDLTLAMVGRGDVVGTLSREDGKPLADPVIVARSVANPEEYAAATINAAGAYVIAGLPVGAVQIAAHDGDAFLYASAYIPAPGQQAHVDIVLPSGPPQPAGDVHGVVVSGDTGEPVAGVQVYLVPEGSAGAVAVATTGPDGAFSMSRVPSGSAWFKAYDPDRRLCVGQRWIDLLADTTNDVQIVTSTISTGSIQGTVYHNVGGHRTPVAGAYVVAQEAGTYAITDAAGAYRLDELPVGAVSLSATDPSSGEGASRQVSLTAQGQVLTVDFDLGPASGSIQGTVVDSQGNPVSGARVAVDRFGSENEATTAGDGTFTLEGMQPGGHVVLATLGDGARLGHANATILYNGDVAETTVVLGGTANVDVITVADTTGGGTTEVLSQIEYRKPGIVPSTGKIGLIPEEGWLQCVQGDSGAECSIDDEGHAHIHNLPVGVGGVLVRAVNAFYGAQTASEELNLSDDGKTKTLTINFSAPGSISGKVVVDDGTGSVPVAGAAVQLWMTNAQGGLSAEQTVVTEADGAYHFDLVRHGGFQIHVHDPASGRVGWIGGSVASAQVVEGLDIHLRGLGGATGQLSVCVPTHAPSQPGDMVHVTLSEPGAPNPLIDGESRPAAIETRELDLDLASGTAEFSFTGLAAGTWSLSARSPLHGAAFASFAVPADGSVLTLADPICLHPTGSISGRVTWPETGEGVPQAQVQLFRDGQPPVLMIADTTAADGTFSFDSLPVGSSYVVAAYEAGSNRGGQSQHMALCDAADSGFGSSCFQSYQVAVALQPLGTVDGTVQTAAGDAVPNAFVRLRAQVVKNQGGTIISSSVEQWAYTDAGGAYTFSGVPAGPADVAAFDPDSSLYAEADANVDPVTNPETTVDLKLPPTADLTVRVLDPDGQPLGDGDPVLALRQWSKDFGEPRGGAGALERLAQGTPVTFDGIVEGDVELGACLGTCADATVGDVLGHNFVDDLGAYSKIAMPNPPQAQVVDLQLVGRAAMNVAVVEGNGDPADGAEVTISGGGFYGGVHVVSQTGADGIAGPFNGIGVGSYAVAATLTDASGNTIRGVTQAVITQADHDQTVPVMVTLENAAAVLGSVIDATGTVAPGALVSMSFKESAQTRLFQTVTDASGAFSFPALPAGQTYELEIAEGNSGRGIYRAHGIEVTSGTLDLGTLQLDNVNPSVASISPDNGVQGAAPDDPVVIDFSELMRHASLQDQTIALRRGGQSISVSLTIEDLPDPDGDGPRGPFTRITLDHPTLESDTLYLVDALRGVEDLGGRTLALDFHSTFQTADTVAPWVAKVSPEDDPTGVMPAGPDVAPVLTFSEIVDSASVDETTIRLVGADGSDINVQRVIQDDGFAVRLRPDSGLALDTFYTIDVSGVSDASGNVMTAPFTSTFRVRDGSPPIVTLLPPGGATVDGGSWSAVEGTALTLRVVVTSNDALASVAFAVDGALLPAAPTLDQASGEYRLGWVVPQGVTQVTLSAQASDVSGNLSPMTEHVLVVTNDAPPNGSLSLNPASQILPNHVLAVAVHAQDDHGLAAAHLTLSGAISGTRDLAFEQGTTGQVSTTYRLPAEAAAGAQIVVGGTVADTLGQTTPLTPATVTVLADNEAPVITTVSPASGATVTSGNTVSFDFNVIDNVAGSDVSLAVDGQDLPVQLINVTDPGDHWAGEATARWIVPEVTTPETLEYKLTVTDPAGNAAVQTGNLTVEPLVNPNAPVVAIGCPVDGDACLPDTQLTVSFSITDDDQIQSYDVLVNGTRVVSGATVDATSINATYDWMPPADAQPGDSFTIRIDARDYAGNLGSTQITLTVPAGTVLTGDQTIDSAYDGEDLVLGPGTYTVDSSLDELTPANMVLVHGAILKTSPLHPLKLTISGKLRVACGAALDASGFGYAGGVGGHVDGYAPEGVSGSTTDAGGSHGGLGSKWNGGVAGEAYDSVYAPALGGGGGSWDPYLDGRFGGGVVVIEAGQLDLEGEIKARGVDRWATSGAGAAGAGGTVRINAATMTGAGLIDASGGYFDEYYGSSGSGGGGRVALNVGSFGGFDPAAQVVLSGGWRGWASDNILDYAGAGTLYVKTSGSTYGDLIVDQGGASGKPVGLTPLPAIGQGTVETVTDDGADAWIVPTAADRDFDLGVVGMWVRIDGTDYRVTAQQDRRTILLEGAAGRISAGQTYQGVYKFDSVTVSGEARLEAKDLLEADTVSVAGGRLITRASVTTSELDIRDSSRMTGDVQAQNAVVHTGAVVKPAEGSELRLAVPGTLTVEADAALDASGFGYAGGVGGHVDGYAPEGVSGSTTDAGGSHGGLGSKWNGGVAGEAYDSVYAPALGGGGGSWDPYLDGRFGGGVVVIEAGQLDLEGEIKARGVDRWATSGAGAAGAGGTVRINAATMTGAGLIDASGGYFDEYYGSSGSGGGGRVALNVGSFGGFDPAAQVVLSGGWRGWASDNILDYAGAGTLYVKTSGSTYGDLIVDQGGASGKPVGLTPLPAIGQGTVETVTDDGADAWIVPTAADRDFDLGVVGMWVRIDGTDYRVTAQQDRRTILLEGAAGRISAGQTYQGVYKFDSVTVHGGAQLLLGDPLEGEPTDVDADSQLILYNEGAPAIDPTRISITAHDGAFWVAGEAGALMDPDGIGSAEVRNTASGATVSVSVAVDGSFAAIRVPGASGDPVEVEATDRHPAPRSSVATLGTLPVNSGPPAVDRGLISVAQTAPGEWQVVGGAGSVTDHEPPVSMIMTDAQTQQTWQTVAGADGAFTVTVTGTAGDSVTLAATDGHPQPAQTTVDLGTLPGNTAPAIDVSLISIRYAPPDEGGGAHYEVGIGSGAVTDDDPPIRLTVTDPAHGDSWSTTLINSGDAAMIRLDGGTLTSGDVLELAATDSNPADPATATVDLPPLPPDNYGPPAVDTSLVRLAPMGLGYQAVGAPGSVSDPDAPLSVTLTDATTGWVSRAIPVRSDGSFSARLRGSEGDAFTITAKDGHPALPLASDSLALGSLPAAGFRADAVATGGSSAGYVNANLVVLDGGSGLAAAILRQDRSETSGESLVDIISGLSGVTKAFPPSRGDSLIDGYALAGGDLDVWLAEEGPWPAEVRPKTITGGSLVAGMAWGGFVYLAADDGSLSFHSVAEPDVIEDWNGGVRTLGWPCNGSVGDMALPSTTGLAALAVIPGPPGVMVVVVNDPTAELRLVDVTDPAAPADGGILDLDGGAAPSWARWNDGQLILAREDGSLQVWRWNGAAMELTASWQSSGTVVSAAVNGSQLWLGLADGRVQQVDLAAPGGPRLLGERQIGGGPVQLADLGTSLLATVDGALSHIWAWELPPDLEPAQVVWQADGAEATLSIKTSGYPSGCAAGDSLAEVTWPGEPESLQPFTTGQNVSLSEPTARTDPPRVAVRLCNGLGGSAYQPALWTPWGVAQATSGPGGAGPPLTPWSLASCRADFLAVGDVGPAQWTATANPGSGQIAFFTVDPSSGLPVELSLPVTGWLTGLLSAEGALYAVTGDGLETWDLANPGNPQAGAPLDLLGQEAISASVRVEDVVPDTGARVSWVIVAGDTSPEIAVVDVSSPAHPAVVADSVPLPGASGTVLGLAWANGSIIVLTDDNGAQRILRYDLTDPTSPQLVGSLDLTGAPVTAMAAGAGGGGGGPSDVRILIAVLRSDGSVELLDGITLTSLGAAALPAPAAGVVVPAVPYGNPVAYVALGYGYGVAQVGVVTGGTVSLRFDYREGGAGALCVPGERLPGLYGVLGLDGRSWVVMPAVAVPY